MGAWTQAELEAGFTHYQEQVKLCAATGDWTHFANLFTEDATYIEHSYGTFHGRDAIQAWVTRTMTSAPGCWMTDFPPSWSVIDEERGRIVCEILNVMSDAGDGVVYQPTNVTILGYAGNGLFDYEEDVYNPARFVDDIRAWGKAAAARDRLPIGAEAWLDGAIPSWRDS